MTDLVDGGTPAYIVREFHLAGKQSMLEIAPGQRPLLPSGFSPNVTNKSLNVGSGAAGRQQGQPSKIGMLCCCDRVDRLRHCGELLYWIGQ
ncbi:hypothetical protein GGQ64_001114 [Rhizobium azooxidifex]|uniref:Uncharacterized protein n=1 Tax=Mycoplana azooxidifex TaxID=1636188 RepID=A0A7W6D882_9HYPH|nr:hypothetical protein [Mycoplana azooxidifex]MBB3975927.1 hypothetical protein [Mycoplana azooxidifex]